MRRWLDERLDVLVWDWDGSAPRGDILRNTSVDSVTFLLEGGDVMWDDDALALDDSA